VRDPSRHLAGDQAHHRLDDHQRDAAQHDQQQRHDRRTREYAQDARWTGGSQVHQFADDVFPMLAAPKRERGDDRAGDDRDTAATRLSRRPGERQLQVSPQPAQQHAQAVAGGQAHARQHRLRDRDPWREAGRERGGEEQRPQHEPGIAKARQQRTPEPGEPAIGCSTGSECSVVVLSHQVSPASGPLGPIYRTRIGVLTA